MFKEYHKNPRSIKSGRLNAIRNNLKDLGDLSGITVDLATKEVITGNQRAKIIDLNNCEIEITKRYKKPTKQGTVNEGYVLWEGQRLNYREVKWDEERRERANVTANWLTGQNDLTKLALFPKSELPKWGVDSNSMNKIKAMEAEAGVDENNQPLYPLVPKMSEEYGYVVIFAENMIDLAYLENFFGLQIEKSYKTSKIGLGRVVHFDKFKKLVNDERVGKADNSKSQKT